jgi:adenylate cyclase
MGLPVNIASRIQTATKDINNSFLASDDLVRLLGNNSYPVTLLGMKGIREPIKVHLLVHLILLHHPLLTGINRLA